MSKQMLMRTLLQSAKGSAACTQRQRILSVLQAGYSLTTIEARRDLDVLAPAVRVLELRRLGHPIATTWGRERTDAGIWHRIARYSLVPGGTTCSL